MARVHFPSYPGDGSFGEGSFPSYPGDGSGEGSDLVHDENTESAPIDSTNNVLIFVDAGGDEAPYYTFYDETKEVINDLRINTSKTYTFRRLDDANSHPFYISDRGHNNESSSKLVLSGDGSFDSGIKGSQSLVLEFVDADSLPDDYKLSYYCTSHSSMVANFEITQDLNDETTITRTRRRTSYRRTSSQNQKQKNQLQKNQLQKNQ